MRAYLLAIALLVLILGSVAGFIYQRFAALAAMDFTPPPVTIAAADAQSEVWSSALEAVGEIAAVRGVELTSEESGEVVAIEFESGQQVVAGKLLVALNDRVEQAARRRHNANLELARQLFARDEKLVQQKSISQTQLDRSRADLEAATAQLAETEAEIENKRIQAPFSGTVGIRRVKLGDYVSPGTVITTLQDLSALEVDFTLPARHFPRLRAGLAVRVHVAAFPGRSFPARIEALDARVDPDTGNLGLRAVLEESEGLLPGMFAELSIDLDQPTELLTVPETAVTYSVHGNTVYRVSEGESGLIVQPTLVKTGPTRDGRIAILSGLNAGDRVATAGQNKLYRGAPVVIDQNVALPGSNQIAAEPVE